jgi:hypothetical protein
MVNKLNKFEKLLYYIKGLVSKEFTGSLEIIFFKGGIRGVKKVHKENIDIKN